MKFTAHMDLEEFAKATMGPHDVIVPGAFGTGKKTVPVYSGPEGSLNRRVIGEVEIDLDTGMAAFDVETPEKMAALDVSIDRLHGPGAAAALDAVIADGSIFGE